jgi:hypothetical protein
MKQYLVFGIELIMVVLGILMATAKQFAISIDRLSTKH